MNILLLLAESGGHSEHPAWWLDPHGPGLVVWTAATFAVVLMILYKLAWGPFVDALDKREEAIAGEVENSRKVRAEAEALKQQYEAQLEGVRQEAQQIIDEGEADKKRIIADAQSKATAEAQAIRDRADREIGLAKQKALAEVRKDAVTVGMAIAEKVINAEVDASRHQKIVDDVLAAYERG